MHTNEPRLAYFYRLKKSILKEILAKGAAAPAMESAAWSDGWTRNVSLGEYLRAVEKMIEALAALRDFEKEPFTQNEENDLNDIWMLETSLN